MNPKQIHIKDYTYELPEDRIAKYPLEERDQSKLLIYKDSNITEDIYRNLPDFIPDNSLLVFNNTKVIHARLLFRNAKSEKIEIFCLEPADENSEPVSAMSKINNVKWKCMVGRSNKWKEKILELKSDILTLSAEIVEKDDSGFTIEFNWQPGEMSFAEVIETIGEMPIPPYLHRDSEEIDESRYQTVYAKQDGSVAAPTAGLHFTPDLLESFSGKNISMDYVTLHVGAATFKPVKSETIEEHEMHSEWIDVKIETIENILKRLEEKENNIIAVGTTSLRTIESLYWMGVKAGKSPECSLEKLEVDQWDPYELNSEIPAFDSLGFLIEWMRNINTERLVCKTRVIIVPSYRLRIADALITNFHQPNSTLLLLVAAIAGDDWREIYKYALDTNFRFLSYGDGSLIFKNKHEE